jgi:hypothetical protein
LSMGDVAEMWQGDHNDQTMGHLPAAAATVWIKRMNVDITEDCYVNAATCHLFRRGSLATIHSFSKSW